MVYISLNSYKFWCIIIFFGIPLRQFAIKNISVSVIDYANREATCLPRAHLMAYMTHSLSVRQIMEHSTYCAIPFLQVLAFYDAVVEGE
jgi:hypothetical protein